mgnify:CR=1 FL=1
MGAEATPLKRAAGFASSMQAVVPAAGQGTRMRPLTETLPKGLVDVDGRPLLLHALDAAAGSQAQPTVVVTGHQREQVEALLAGRTVQTVHNPDYGAGLSTSLKAGLSALPDDVDGVVVLLGDMPRVGPQVVDRLIAAFDPTGGAAICVPSWRGKRGNPVLLARRFFPEIKEIAGDIGAKPILAEYPEQIRTVEIADDGVLTDLDTPDALAAYRERG